MITLGKWESLITVPTGDWTFDIDEVGGGDASATITLTAATAYYHSSAGNDTVDLAARLTALIAASALNATYTVALSAGEDGTGCYTISATGGSVTEFEIDWTSTALRDVLGMAANPTGALTYTGDAAEGLWIPDGPHASLTGLGDWIDEDDETVTETSAGDVYRLSWERKTTQTDLVYHGISRARTRIAGETVTGESFQQFWRDAIQGDKSYLSSLRVYPDADTDATYTTCNAGSWPSFRPAQMREGWLGYWSIGVPRLIVEP